MTNKLKPINVGVNDDAVTNAHETVGKTVFKERGKANATLDLFETRRDEYRIVITSALSGASIPSGLRHAVINHVQTYYDNLSTPIYKQLEMLDNLINGDDSG